MLVLLMIHGSITHCAVTTLSYVHVYRMKLFLGGAYSGEPPGQYAYPDFNMYR